MATRASVGHGDIACPSNYEHVLARTACCGEGERASSVREVFISHVHAEDEARVVKNVVAHARVFVDVPLSIIHVDYGRFIHIANNNLNFERVNEVSIAVVSHLDNGGGNNGGDGDGGGGGGGGRREEAWRTLTDMLNVGAVSKSRSVVSATVIVPSPSIASTVCPDPSSLNVSVWADGSFHQLSGSLAVATPTNDETLAFSDK